MSRFLLLNIVVSVVMCALLQAVPTDQSSIPSNPRQKRQNWNPQNWTQNGQADRGFISGQSTPETVFDSATPDVDCMRACRRNSVTSEYAPVCGTNGQTYDNQATMVCAQRCGINVDYVRFGKCS